MWHCCPQDAPCGRFLSASVRWQGFVSGYADPFCLAVTVLLIAAILFCWWHGLLACSMPCMIGMGWWSFAGVALRCPFLVLFLQGCALGCCKACGYNCSWCVCYFSAGTTAHEAVENWCPGLCRVYCQSVVAACYSCSYLLFSTGGGAMSATQGTPLQLT